MTNRGMVFPPPHAGEVPRRDQWYDFRRELRRESDRAVAILGAVMLERQLRAVLEAFFVRDAKRVTVLLERGPLSSLAALTDVTYTL